MNEEIGKTMFEKIKEAIHEDPRKKEREQRAKKDYDETLKLQEENEALFEAIVRCADASRATDEEARAMGLSEPGVLDMANRITSMLLLLESEGLIKIIRKNSKQ